MKWFIIMFSSMDFLECIKNNNVLNWGIIDEKTKWQNKEYLKNGAGILESEYKTTIGNITIYTDIKKGDILVFKTDKAKKDRSSGSTDKRQMQSTH